MMIRKRDFDAVGGMDEGFFLYWEDADFCKRLHDAGLATAYHPGVAVTHIGGRSSTGNRRALVAFHRSAYRYFTQARRGHRPACQPAGVPRPRRPPGPEAAGAARRPARGVEVTDLALRFGVALLAGLLLMPAVRALAARFGVVARPTPGRWHQRPTPLLGGVAIAVIVIAGP